MKLQNTVFSKVIYSYHISESDLPNRFFVDSQVKVSKLKDFLEMTVAVVGVYFQKHSAENRKYKSFSNKERVTAINTCV